MATACVGVALYASIPAVRADLFPGEGKEGCSQYCPRVNTSRSACMDCCDRRCAAVADKTRCNINCGDCEDP